MPTSKTATAIEKFNRMHSKEVDAEVLEEVERRLVVFFGGAITESCSAADYFDDLAVILAEAHGADYAPWSSSVARGKPGFIVTYAKIDFLGELRSVAGEVCTKVRGRVNEFEEIGRRADPEEIFSELCYCILTANYTAEGGIRIQHALRGHFRTKPLHEIADCLKSLGHRFPNKRAEFICEARSHSVEILEALKMGSWGAREWLVQNVKGLGYKEASHFLRNVGRKDVAIVDRHILRFLCQKGLIPAVPRSPSRGRYLSIEALLDAISRSLEVNLAELDLYLWYLMTGKILK